MLLDTDWHCVIYLFFPLCTGFAIKSSTIINFVSSLLHRCIPVLSAICFCTSPWPFNPTKRERLCIVQLPRAYLSISLGSQNASAVNLIMWLPHVAIGVSICRRGIVNCIIFSHLVQYNHFDRYVSGVDLTENWSVEIGEVHDMAQSHGQHLLTRT